MLGLKSSLMSLIVEITGIPSAVLLGQQSVYDCSVAQRFSWASNRLTTRVEDIAYSLIGLFNINMPLLYGEGEKAFVRLQEEILKDSSDQTIFAWSDGDDFNAIELTTRRDKLDLRGVLATHPKYFQGSAGFQPKPIGYLDDANDREIASTNLGLRLNVPLHNCGYFIAAELAVIAKARSSSEAQHAHASWALPENHVCIILWPESGGKGRLMRISAVPCVLKSRLPTAVKSPSVALMLKSNWTQRHYVRTVFSLNIRRDDAYLIRITKCSYTPFPVGKLGLMKARGSEASWQYWEYWESSSVGETLFVLEFQCSPLNASSFSRWKGPERREYTLLVWLHPHIASQCWIVEGSIKNLARIIDTLGSKLSITQSLNVPGVGQFQFRCEKPGIGETAQLFVSRENP